MFGYSRHGSAQYDRFTMAFLQSNVFGPGAWKRWLDGDPELFLERELKRFVKQRLLPALFRTFDMEVQISPYMQRQRDNLPDIETNPVEWYLAAFIGRPMGLALEGFLTELRHQFPDRFYVSALAFIELCLGWVMRVFSWEEILESYDQRHFFGPQEIEGGYEGDPKDPDFEHWSLIPEPLLPVLSVKGLSWSRFHELRRSLPEGRVREVLRLCQDLKTRSSRSRKSPLFGVSPTVADVHLEDTCIPMYGVVYGVHPTDAIYAHWEHAWDYAMDTYPAPNFVFPLNRRRRETIVESFWALDRWCGYLNTAWEIFNLMDPTALEGC